MSSEDWKPEPAARNLGPGSGVDRNLEAEERAALEALRRLAELAGGG